MAAQKLIDGGQLTADAGAPPPCRLDLTLGFPKPLASSFEAGLGALALPQGQREVRFTFGRLCCRDPAAVLQFCQLASQLGFAVALESLELAGQPVDPRLCLQIRLVRRRLGLKQLELCGAALEPSADSPQALGHAFGAVADPIGGRLGGETAT
jgi:hypothetical protein